MNLSTKPRRRLVRLALPSAASVSLILCLLLAASSPAAESSTRSEEHAVRAEEHAARTEERAASAEQRTNMREAEKAARAAEREASRESAPKLEHGCRVSIEASTARAVTGATVTLSGTLECPLAASAAGQQVAIYERQGGGALTFVADATAEANGSYELTPPALAADTVFQARVGHQRARVAVKVAPAVTLAIVPANAQASAAGTQASPGATRAKAPARTRTTFTGTVTPAVDGALVALQVSYAAAGGRWHSVAYSHVNAAGEYAIEHAFKAAGQASVRTVVRLGSHYAPAISEALAYEAPQPQNQQLSIDASADPLVYGQSLTISGVAAGAAGQAVALFARTGAGAFTEVAQSTTGPGGEYTFTQAPLQSAYYRVSDAGAQSTTLFDGVSFALTSEPAPSSVQSGQPLVLSGTLSPASTGQLVYLESQYPSGLGFHAIASGTVGSGDGYEIEHVFATRGTFVLRTRVLGDGKLQESTSAPFTVSVSR